MFGHHGVRDARHVGAGVARRLGFGQRPVLAQAVGIGEVALRLAHGAHVGHDAGAHVIGAFLDVGRVVLEHHDAIRVHQTQGPAKPRMQHMGRHAGVVLMDEPPVRAQEDAVALPGVGGGRGRLQQMAQDDLFKQGARRPDVRRGGIGRGMPGHQAGRLRDIAQLRLPKRQQTARLDDGRSQRVATRHDLVDRDAFARLQARHQPHVGAGAEPDVVGVLAVDAFKALGDHQPHAGGLFGHRAVLARRAFAIPLARDHDVDARPPDRVDADGLGVARPIARVRIPAQFLVEVRQDRHRRDLVGGNVVAQRRGVKRRQRRAAQLRGHADWVLRQKQQAGRGVEYRYGSHGNPVIRW